MNKLLLVLLLICVIPSANAWSCDVHQKICNDIGLSSYDCCLADTSHTPGATYHHCADNATDCGAREKAFGEYGNNTAIKAHLLADSMCPVHWYSFSDSDCHSDFEDMITGDIVTHFSLVCQEKNGTDILVSYDGLTDIESYVAANMNTAVITVKTPMSFFESFMAWINEMLRWVGL